MTTLATVIFLVLFLLAGGMGTMIALVRGARHLRERLRARRAARPRRVLLALAADGGTAERDELVALPAREWRAVEPTVLELLPKVRGEARTALAEVFIRRGLVSRARRDLRRRGPVRRARAAGVLGSLSHRSAVPELCRLLMDPHPEVRVAAVHSLGRIADPAAAGPLLASLAAPLPAPSLLVAHSLIQLGPPAVPALVAALDDPTPLVRMTALDAIRQLGASVAEPEVAAALRSDPSLEVRLRAAGTLGRIGTRAALPDLLAACEPERPAPLRAEAARALGELGAVAAVAPLRALLSSPDYRTGHEAAGALLRLGADGAAALAEAAAGTDRAAAHAREVLALADLQRQYTESIPLWPAAVAGNA
jgi:HEAT repeat protein